MKVSILNWKLPQISSSGHRHGGHLFTASTVVTDVHSSPLVRLAFATFTFYVSRLFLRLNGMEQYSGAENHYVFTHAHTYPTHVSGCGSRNARRAVYQLRLCSLLREMHENVAVSRLSIYIGLKHFFY